jgi:hypothetical protein
MVLLNQQGEGLARDMFLAMVWQSSTVPAAFLFCVKYTLYNVYGTDYGIGKKKPVARPQASLVFQRNYIRTTTKMHTVTKSTANRPYERSIRPRVSLSISIHL